LDQLPLDQKELTCHPERRSEPRLRGEDKRRDLGFGTRGRRGDAGKNPGPSDDIFLLSRLSQNAHDNLRSEPGCTDP
jgi:hypothetical protein